jgi:Ca2+-binding RTX toxin-like protein
MDASYRSFVEPLESRRLMAATVTGVRVLVITADDVATTVNIDVVSRTRFTLTIDGGAPTEYGLGRVRAVRFFGGAGDDRFEVKSLRADPANRIFRNTFFSRRAILFGGDGNDTLIDGYGNGRIDGGAGNDTIFGGGGADVIIGGAGDDTIVGGPPATEPSLRDGNDIVFGASGNDTIEGGQGRDVLFGQDGDDTLVGGPSRDALYGMAGNDLLVGGPDRDILYSGKQPGDVLQGTAGDDQNDRQELDQMGTYLPRILRAYVMSAMRGSARS